MLSPETYGSGLGENTYGWNGQRPQPRPRPSPFSPGSAMPKQEPSFGTPYDPQQYWPTDEEALAWQDKVANSSGKIIPQRGAKDDGYWMGQLKTEMLRDRNADADARDDYYKKRSERNAPPPEQPYIQFRTASGSYTQVPNPAWGKQHGLTLIGDSWMPDSLLNFMPRGTLGGGQSSWGQNNGGWASGQGGDSLLDRLGKPANPYAPERQLGVNFFY